MRACVRMRAHACVLYTYLPSRSALRQRACLPSCSCLRCQGRWRSAHCAQQARAPVSTCGMAHTLPNKVAHALIEGCASGSISEPAEVICSMVPGAAAPSLATTLSACGASTLFHPLATLPKHTGAVAACPDAHHRSHTQLLLEYSAEQGSRR